MPRAAVEELLFMLDEAFEPPTGEGPQALLPNLRGVDEANLLLTPNGGARSIYGILVHLGACKYVGDSLGFGDGSLGYDSPIAYPWPTAVPPMADLLQWLKEGHRRFRDHLASAEDSELSALRRTTDGEQITLRRLVSGFIQHDLYHAGEINHIRSLLANDDRWAHER